MQAEELEGIVDGEWLLVGGGLDGTLRQLGVPPEWI